MAAGSPESTLGSARVAIPHGVARDGALTRDLRLRPVAGEDHAFLLDTAESLTPSERASALLVRCLDEEDPATLVGSLVAGDREALLLNLRRTTLGDGLECVLRCPAAECGETMQIELQVGDLLVEPYEDVRATYEIEVDDAGPDQPVRLAYRLPTVADLRAASAAGRGDPEATVADLLVRCVSRASPRSGGKAPKTPGVEALSSTAQEAIAAAMAERDPQAEIELDLTCPVCETPFSILFDAAAFFLQELDAQSRSLFEEVHALAFHYHWSERDILAMAPSRRERYIGLLVDALRSSDAAGLGAT